MSIGVEFEFGDFRRRWCSTPRDIRPESDVGEMVLREIGVVAFGVAIEIGVFASAILPESCVVEDCARGFVVFAINVDLVGYVGRRIETATAIFGYIVACEKWAIVFFG